MLEYPKAQSANEAKMREIKTMDNQQETGIAWLAGILDGEGYVSICMNQHKGRANGQKKIQYSPRVSIGSTSQEIIEKCILVLKSIEVGHLVKDRELKSGKLFSSVIVVGALRVKKLIPFVLPYLTLKKANATRMLEFIDSRLSKERNITYTTQELELVRLCKTGSSETTRRAPSGLKPLDDDIVHTAGKPVEYVQ
jgi:hypothetical protein